MEAATGKAMKKLAKKLSALMLSAIMLTVLAACGGGRDEELTETVYVPEFREFDLANLSNGQNFSSFVKSPGQNSLQTAVNSGLILSVAPLPSPSRKAAQTALQAETRRSVSFSTRGAGFPQRDAEGSRRLCR